MERKRIKGSILLGAYAFDNIVWLKTPKIRYFLAFFGEIIVINNTNFLLAAYGAAPAGGILYCLLK